MRIPTRKSEIERLLAQTFDPNITQEMYDRMQKELARLSRDRVSFAQEVARLAQMGDLSENAAYQYAKQHLRGVLSRITQLEHHLAHAVIITPSQGDDGKIRLGSAIEVLRESDKKRFTWRIVGSQEANPARGDISHKSPLGNAFLGHKTGETITVHLAQGDTFYSILSVIG